MQNNKFSRKQLLYLPILLKELTCGGKVKMLALNVTDNCLQKSAMMNNDLTRLIKLNIKANESVLDLHILYLHTLYLHLSFLVSSSISSIQKH